MVDTLRWKNDEAQNSTRIWKRNLLVLHEDHRLLQASHNKLILRFADLQFRIQQDHPNFQVSRMPDHRPQG
jgi:hypothetical protein